MCISPHSGNTTSNFPMRNLLSLLVLAICICVAASVSIEKRGANDGALRPLDAQDRDVCRTPNEKGSNVDFPCGWTYRGDLGKQSHRCPSRVPCLAELSTEALGVEAGLGVWRKLDFFCGFRRGLIDRQQSSGAYHPPSVSLYRYEEKYYNVLPIDVYHAQ
ncbi:hypothetical protein M427DRAFT_453639 [Gonapodya prolifera JEL478]|uniref:Uncharacterized protein n=1 Tax=Gonapodya prolifera (strain JEL478) TaxID=1344416 RepID=A0A139ASA7_GONPJ|nr:hypothetical protein M427DRAFT_453639 [Gonapodya prolifera JEL478]|eukprot:KXS19579.1 hypothetical protein M427DRAFT_453639 [Gonapodya prolifera JEL478]